MAKEKNVLPKDMVEVKFKKSSFHNGEQTSMIHSALAEKLIKQGKCELVKGGKTEKSAAPVDGTQNV